MRQFDLPYSRLRQLFSGSVFILDVRHIGVTVYRVSKTEILIFISCHSNTCTLSICELKLLKSKLDNTREALWSCALQIIFRTALKSTAHLFTYWGFPPPFSDILSPHSTTVNRPAHSPHRRWAQGILMWLHAWVTFSTPSVAKNISW